MSCRLQFAIDLLDLSEALRTADKVSECIDIFEAGTPLIKSAGIKAVRRLKKEFPTKLILADLKSSDVGAYEAEMAFRAGADITTTLGVTTNATILAVQRVADQWGRICQVDLTGVAEPAKRVLELRKLGISSVIYHRSIDEETTQGASWSEITLEELAQISKLDVRLSIAGELNVENLPLFSGLPLYAIVIGRGITSAPNPVYAAKSISEFVKELWGN